MKHCLAWQPARLIPRMNPLRLALFFIGVMVVVIEAPSLDTVQAAPAVVPTLISPSDGSTSDINNYPPLGIPDFVWSSVGGATNYRIQFSSDIGFASIAHEIITPNTQYTPLSVSTFTDGLWYWRVRVESPSIGSYSSAFSFTKSWASSGNLPTLSAPADSASLEFYDSPNFSWLPPTGAARFNFQISANPPNFVAPLYNQPTLDFAHQPLIKLSNGSYSWRVLPLDPASRQGTPSLVRSFTLNYNQIPTQLQPANGSSPTFTPSFSWTAVRGAQFYRLQYSTDPSLNSGVTTVDTNNTTYTPPNALANDVNFFWRVRAQSGNSIASWSPTWSFIKRWYLTPTLLTPQLLYQYTSEPFFSWTPVPGAARYQIEVSTANSFPPVGGFTDSAVNPFYVRPNNPWESLAVPYTWYWRVTPIDSAGNFGQPSNVFSFNNPPTLTVVPRLIYPAYYYTPTASITITPTVGFRPREDRTISEPVFMWHRFVTATAPISQTNAYRVQVNSNGVFPGSFSWQFDTANLSASPTSANPFTPTVGGIYYWRVLALDGVGGSQIGQPSQIWKTRIDTSLITNTMPSITLLRPINGYESVETDPMLEWYPRQGADSYDVQISTGDLSTFDANIVISATVPYPVYTPSVRLVYDGSMPYGTFYWRVRANSGGGPLGSFSTPWRFQVAAQSHWKEPRILGNNRLQIAADTPGDMTDSSYDLTNLYAAQSSNYWYFGFNATGSSDVVYGMYLDLDHVDNSGGTSDPYGLNVATIPAHQPEYAIYAVRASGVFSAENTYIYPWNPGSRPTRLDQPSRPASWGTPLQLSSIGGSLYFSPTINYVELQIPNTAIGMQGTTGSAAVSLFTAPAAGGHAQDTVPSDPNVAYATVDLTGITSTLTRFTNVSERVTLTMPPNNISGDPTNFPTVPPFLWQASIDDSWYGYNLQVATDSQYTSQILDYSVAGSPLIPPDYTHNNGDLNGDNTYYWRVRPIYNSAGNPKGAWSQGTAFDRQGFVLTSNAYNSPIGTMTTTITFATPTFLWDMVEGAESYEVQVDNDPAFGSNEASTTTNQTSFTPSGTLDNGTYYWRVRVRRYNGVYSNWSSSQSFTLSLPQPSGLTPSGGVVNRAPTFCWTPLIASSGGNPVLAAYKYRVQVSNNDITFSSIYDTADTEQSCWTPTKGYVEGTLYWRVAMLDGQNRAGSYTSPVSFTKQYPITTLVSPPNGSSPPSTPSFIWTPVNGAASYRIQVSTSPIFASFIDNQTTNNVHYTPALAFAKTTYYWRVAIIDSDGIQGPFNTATIIVGGANKLYLPLIKR